MKDTVLGWVRTALTIIGSLVIGKVVAHHTLDTAIINDIIGGALFIGATAWGIFDKTVKEEMVTSALAKLITFGCGIAMTAGIINEVTATAILGAVPLIAIEIMKRVTHSKEKKVAGGQLGVADLSASRSVEGPIDPQVNTPPK